MNQYKKNQIKWRDKNKKTVIFLEKNFAFQHFQWIPPEKPSKKLTLPSPV